VSLDLASVRALAAEKAAKVGPCNRRCQQRGECAFGRAESQGCYCRERRPPCRAEALQLDTRGEIVLP
jgi:hypothetical protein